MVVMSIIVGSAEIVLLLGRVDLTVHFPTTWPCDRCSRPGVSVTVVSRRFETISFLSDYGLADEFVGVCTAVVRDLALT